MHDLAPGSLFAARYRIAKVLGRGGMGAVYLARDVELEEDVALKVLTVGDGEWIDRFRREVRLARRVTHRNVARTFDFGRHEDVCFLTMEYVAGESLARVLEAKGALGAREAASVVLDTAEALDAAHAVGVIHRDLKPANLMLAEDGRTVVTDFGVARSLTEDDGLKTLGAIGTPAYMAPEQFAGAELGPYTDLYALGLILITLATGQRPGDAFSRYQHGVEDPRAYADVPDVLATLALRLTAAEPAARPTAREVSEILRAFLEGDDPAPTVTRAELPSTRRKPFAPLSSAALTIAVLPFAYRGDEGSSYLGDSLAEGVVDVLARNRGLKVLAAARRDASAPTTILARPAPSSACR